MNEDPYRDLAQWLQEAARRKTPGYESLVEVPAPKAVRVARRTILRETIWLGALVGAWLQYYMMDVMLQIATMKSVVVFV